MLFNFEMAQVEGILPHDKNQSTSYTVNTVAADGLATQGIRVSAAMVLAYLSPEYSALSPRGVKYLKLVA